MDNLKRNFSASFRWKNKFVVFKTKDLRKELPNALVHFPPSGTGMFVPIEEIVDDNGFFYDYLTIMNKVKLDTKVSYYIEKSLPTEEMMEFI